MVLARPKGEAKHGRLPELCQPRCGVGTVSHAPSGLSPAGSLCRSWSHRVSLLVFDLNGRGTGFPGKFAFDTLQERWGPERLNRFLELITDEDRLNLKKSLQLLKPEATVSQLRGKNADINDILTQLLWVSSHWLPYLWRDEWSIDYHGTVCWCAGKLKLPKQDIQTLPTFALERKILEQLFIQMWDKLPPKEREKLLCQLDKNGCIQDKAAIAALSGAASTHGFVHDGNPERVRVLHDYVQLDLRCCGIFRHHAAVRCVHDSQLHCCAACWPRRLGLSGDSGSDRTGIDRSR
jgi:hypothetical protein